MIVERTVKEQIRDNIYSTRQLRIELTPQELERAFRIRQREYLLEDICGVLNEWVQQERISKEDGATVLNDRKVVEQMADLYERREDCNVAYNDTLGEVIREVLASKGMEVD